MTTKNRKPQTLAEANIKTDVMPYVNIKDMVGQVLILHTVRYKATNTGEYPIFTCELTDRPRLFEMGAYGSTVYEQAKSFPAEAYPLLVKVVSVGNTCFFE